MPIFKTTQHIFNNPWGPELLDIPTPVSANNLPNKSNWPGEYLMSIADVKLWEQIYYKTGEIGIYAAWDPYDEYYIIVHNLFINSKFGIEEFYGSESVNNVWNRAKELGIELPPS